MSKLRQIPPAESAEFERRLAAGVCVSCGHPFTDANVHSNEGWAETHISQTCEDCFDEITAEPDEDPDPDLDDEYEDALMNCSQFVSDGVIYCGAIGSEPCDECPFHDDIGTTVEKEET